MKKRKSPSPIQIKVTINPSYEWGEYSKGAGISYRELEILSLLVQGHDNKEIANILDIKHQSVKNHMHNFMKKLDVRNGAQAYIIAILENLISVTRSAGELKLELDSSSMAESFSRIIENDSSLKKKERENLIELLEKHDIDLDKLKGKD
jgi:DNA-binding CsgD family transcriptional regulator